MGEFFYNFLLDFPWSGKSFLKKVVPLKIEFLVGSPPMINFFIISGQLSPQNLPQSCGLETKMPDSPFLVLKDTKELEHLEKTLALYEKFVSQDDPNFWRKRLIIAMGVSPHIISMSLVPSKQDEPATLFIQKKEEDEEVVGFFLPYLLICKDIPRITDEESLTQSLEGLDESVCGEILQCLTYFLHDPKTASLALTYQGQEGACTTCCWTKGLS